MLTTSEWQGKTRESLSEGAQNLRVQAVIFWENYSPSLIPISRDLQIL